MPEPTPEIRWPGAVVAGGGVTALLTALELERRQISTLVVEQESLCSGQTGKCHGWLHRGAVFPDAEAEDVDQLDRGARRWDRIVRRAPGHHTLVGCRVGGVHERTHDVITGTWDRLGLEYRGSDDVVAGPFRWLLSGPESAIRPLDVLRDTLAPSSVTLRSGRAVSLVPDRPGTRAASLVVRAGQRTLRIRADSFVLANGEGLTAALPDARISSRVTRRLSFMLVVRSNAVGATGLAVPEQEALGLFAVPRTRDQERGRYLLISNFISYAPSADATLSRSHWLAGIRCVIRRFLPDVWHDDDALWGIYPAVKVEPRRDLALGVSNMAVLPTSFDNVLVGLPGKLVLAPLLAERLADAVLPHARSCDGRSAPAPCSDGALSLLPAARWGPEEWEVTPLLRRDTLFQGDDAP
ncbi:FAD-dependent oxidoreductase [Streptomyces sp. B6B3]|uniref:FAD-dependent oxidoreductase n=1 Tax=Streptomyces sp. B6B3 TaxID=3153570 RepID=UPI00325D0D49